MVYWMRAPDRRAVQDKANEAFFVLYLVWLATFGYWTIQNFINLSTQGVNGMKCLSTTPFSMTKLAYQICMIIGGFPAVMCICALSFLSCAVPYIAYDYFKQRADERIRESRRAKLRQTLYRVAPSTLERVMGASAECCICMGSLTQASPVTTPI